MSINEAFGRALRALRDERAYSQLGMSEACGGFALGYLSRLERGKLTPSLRTVVAICQGMNITVAELARRIEQQAGGAAITPQ